MRRSLRIFVAAGALLALTLSSGPARAQGAAVCETAATVNLSQTENLLLVDGGSGALAGFMLCQGGATGSALSMSGTFAFCAHRPNGTHSAQCVTTPPQDLDPVASAASMVAPVVSHVRGTISFALDSGVACSLTLNGHTYGAHADLTMTGFECTNGFGQPGGAEIARAEATAAILVNPLLDCAPGPGGAKACFNQVAFGGVLVIIDQ